MKRHFSSPSRVPDQSRRPEFGRQVGGVKEGANSEKTGTSEERRSLHKSSGSAKKPAKKLKASTPGETFRRILPCVPFPTSSSLSSSLSLLLSLLLCDPLIQCVPEQPNPDNKARSKQRQKTLTAMLYKVVHPDSDNLVSAHGCRPTRE